MVNAPANDDGIPRVSESPEQVQRYLKTLRELARPMKSAWQMEYLAVFSCGVDGRIFRPEGVGYPQDEKINEDLRKFSPLLRRISDHLQSIRSEGGRIYLREEGAFTWDESRQEIICFLKFPGRQAAAVGSEREKLGTTESPPSPGSGEIRKARTGEEANGSPSKEGFVDRLTEVPHLGHRKAQALWRRGYRSIEDVMNTPVTELTQVPWLGSKIARRIKSVLGASESEMEPHSEPSHQKPATSSVRDEAQSTSVQDFRKPYSIFQADPLEQLRVETIRASANNLREMVRSHRVPRLETFSSAVYRFETETNIDDRDLSGALFNPWISMPQGLIGELRMALDEERATLSGNYLWGGDYGFGEHLDEDEDRRSVIEESFRLLGLSRIAPVEQAERIADLPGFGPISASGLVTMCRPDGFTLFYQRPFEMMGVEIDALRNLSEWFPSLREGLGAEDGLELARFVRLLQDGGFEMLLRRHNESA